MRILVHSINYRPELTGIAKYTTEMSEWLAARGHEVTVVAPPPYYPQWRVAEPYRQWRFTTTTESGVRVRRAPIWIPKLPGGLTRVAYTLSFALSSLPVLLAEAFRRPDVVFAIEPSFLNLPVAWLAARLGGARAWLHIQDFEIDLAYDLGQLRRGRRFAAAIERFTSRRFDVVSSISKPMLDRARAKRIARDELFLLPNWFDAQEIRPLPEPSPFRARLGIPDDSVVALFAGSLGRKQGIEMIVEAARRMAHLPIHFVISGEGVAAASLKSAAKNLKNVQFLPLQPAADLNALLNLADIHLLPQRERTEGSLFPSKLIGMLASGRPVVAMSPKGSEVAECIEGCGIRVDCGDVGSFCSAIRGLAAHQTDRQDLGRRARERALDRFRHDVILANLEIAFAHQSKQPARALAQSTGNETAPPKSIPSNLIQKIAPLEVGGRASSPRKASALLSRQFEKQSLTAASKERSQVFHQKH
jgi:colanic acid biosynthesis glycosyl transferase WcaI